MNEFKLTSSNCHKYFGHLEDHQYRHYNHALGIQIYSKEHFIYEMNKRNMLPYDLAEGMAEDWDKNNKSQEYGELSPKARNIIQSLKQTADKDGNLKLGGRAINALMDIGAIQYEHEHKPKEYQVAGGFN